MASVFQNLNKLYLRLSWVFTLVVFLSSCQELALETQGDDRAKCEEGYEFKTITRRCESIVIKNAPPKATLDYISIAEDTEPTTIELSFVDQNEDPPLGCDITSFSDTLDGDTTYPVSCFCDETLNKCFAKIKPDTNFFSSAEFSYVIFDRDGRSNEKFVFVDVTPVDDAPSVDIDEFSDEAKEAVIIARGLGVVNDMSEDSTKTFEFFASDIDGDEITACEIIDSSANIDPQGDCVCTPGLDGLFSICEISIKAKQNFYGVGEFFNYRVYSQNPNGVRLYSGISSFFIDINPVDDAPILCQVSKNTDAPECQAAGRDSCVGFSTPEELGIIPSSHTAKIPVFYLNETTGECFRSFKDSSGVVRFVGNIRDETTYNTGVTDNITGGEISYVNGADFVFIDETTTATPSVTTFTLSSAYDVDNLRSEISYAIDELPEHISIKSCLGYDETGVADGSTNEVLNCTFELNTENYNDHILSDTALLKNNKNGLPSLRFRARQTGDLKKSNHGPICLSFIGGNVNGNASVSHEYRDTFTLDDGPFCYGGYGDEVEYSVSSGSICGELGVASLELSTGTKINIGDTLVIRVSGLEDPESIEDRVLTFSDCGTTCLTSQINLDSSSGAYLNNYSDYTSTIARRILDRLRAINDGAAIEAKIADENANKIIFRSRTLAPYNFSVSKSSSALSITKIQPYWVYRGDSGVGDLSCVGENGQLGNHFLISIEEGKTTSATIKSAIESHEKANELIEVFIYGSIHESYKPIDTDGNSTVDPSEQWPLVLLGGREFSDSFTYKAFSNGEESNIGRVYFNISDINQAPEFDNTADIEFSGDDGGVEETTLVFSLPPATDADFLENLYYEIVQNSFYETLQENGTLRGCLNLEGSDGPWDLTCEFIPNVNFNTDGDGPLKFNYRVIDSQGETDESNDVEIHIEDNNDPAFMCQYDTFKYAPECGLDGCYGEVTPVGRIIPRSHTADRPVVFYSYEEQTCFKSNGNSSADQWEKVVGSLIRDVEINQLQKIVIDNLIIDEGGGEHEDHQLLGLFSITFPDQAEESTGPEFLPVENIKVFYPNSANPPIELTPFSEDSPFNFGDHGDSGDLQKVRLEITPVAGNSGETTVRINFGDYVDNDSTIDELDILQQQSFAEFKVKLNQVNVTHNGWKNLKVLGPRIGGSPYCEIKTPIVNVADYENQKKALTRGDCDNANGIWRSGDLVDSPNVCSFSETLCNSGQGCIGADHLSASADEFNAIFKNTSNGTCHVAKSQMSIGQATLTGKKSGGIFIYVEHLGEGEGNSIEVQDTIGEGEFNHSSFIHLRLDPSTTYDQLGALISGADFEDDMECSDGDASCLVSIDLPSLSETVNEFNIEADLPSGLYYIGVKDAYTYKNRGLLIVTYLSGASVEIVDNDDAVAVEYIDSEKMLRISANTFDETIDGVKIKINTEVLKDLFKRELFSAFIYDDPENTITGQSKTSFSLMNNSYSWVDLVTPCSVTQSDELSVCRQKGFGGSCLVFQNPINDLSEAGDGLGIDANFTSSFYDQRTNRCYRLKEIDASNAQTFIEYDATGSVKLEWENFSSGDASIAGFNVYRRIGKVSKEQDPDPEGYLEGEFDLTRPINVELLGSNTTSFTDDFSTSRHPPLPGTVYYYTVKPVVTGSNGEQIITNSLQSYATIRLFSPIPNFAFVHRWIVNKTMCNLMHANNRTNGSVNSDQYKISEDNNFRCRYFGIGMSDDSGAEITSGIPTDAFYDIGYDMLVNQAELSCPYSRRQCSFGEDEYEDLDCIGNVDPSVAANKITPLSENAVFYNRGTGKCYVANAVDTVGSWFEINDLSAELSKVEVGLSNIYLPPMSSVSKDTASSLCQSTDSNHTTFGLLNGSGTNGRTYSNIISSPGVDIPSRRQQRAYSLWSDDLAHEEIEILENGLSLNSTSRCNTQSANGLDEEFTSSTNPPVNTPSTVTATNLSSFVWKDGESKLIRSLMTGSDNTKNCQSRFGIQDHIGNLSEWSIDFFREVAVINGELEIGFGLNSTTLFGNHYYNFFGQDSLDNLNISDKNQSIGISLSDADNLLEERNFVLDSASDITGAMNIPLGLPVRPGAVNDLSESNFVDFIFSIGTTSGIETDHLHSDRFSLYEDYNNNNSVIDEFNSLINSDSSKISMLYGGGFRDGGGAGVYFIQLENSGMTARPDIGSRCVHQIYDDYYPQ